MSQLQLMQDVYVIAACACDSSLHTAMVQLDAVRPLVWYAASVGNTDRRANRRVVTVGRHLAAAIAGQRCGGTIKDGAGLVRTGGSARAARHRARIRDELAKRRTIGEKLLIGA